MPKSYSQEKYYENEIQHQSRNSRNYKENTESIPEEILKQLEEGRRRVLVKRSGQKPIEYIRAQTPPPIIKRVVERLPTPEPEIIERVCF
jgi:hypothetical protein